MTSRSKSSCLDYCCLIVFGRFWGVLVQSHGYCGQGLFFELWKSVLSDRVGDLGDLVAGLVQCCIGNWFLWCMMVDTWFRYFLRVVEWSVDGRCIWLMCWYKVVLISTLVSFALCFIQVISLSNCIYIKLHFFQVTILWNYLGISLLTCIFPKLYFPQVNPPFIIIVHT